MQENARYGGLLLCLNRTSQYHNRVLNVPSAKCAPCSLSTSHSPVQQGLFSFGFAFVMEREMWTDLCAVKQGTKLKLIHRFSKRVKCYRIAMLLHRSNSRTNKKRIVGKLHWPRRKFNLHYQYLCSRKLKLSLTLAELYG